MKIQLTKKIDLAFILVFFTLLLLEIIACYYSYFTLGEVRQIGYIFIFFLNVIPIVLYFLRLKIVSLFLALIIGFLLIPNQISLLVKWNDLKTESSQIIKYIYQYEESNKRFPVNILDYQFENKKLIDHFSYHHIDTTNFSLYYFVGTKGTTHFYFHNVGKWDYYPD